MPRPISTASTENDRAMAGMAVAIMVASMLCMKKAPATRNAMALNLKVDRKLDNG